MIILKKYNELILLANQDELNDYKKLSIGNIKIIEKEFNHQISIIEKKLNSLYEFFKDFEIRGKEYDKNGFNFEINGLWDLRIPRAINPEIRFRENTNNPDKILAAYNIKKESFFLYISRDLFKKIPILNKNGKHLSVMLEQLDKSLIPICNDMFNPIIEKKLFEIHYLCRFLYQNIEKKKSSNFMNNSFKIKNIKEVIELEIIKNDYVEPKLTKKIQRLNKS